MNVLVRMLGPFEVDGVDGPVALAGASQRTILAALALRAGRPVGVPELVDALWPEDPPPSARNTLQSHVARLRTRLGEPGLISHDAAGYRLNLPRSAVDALLFEDLLRPPLAGETPAAARPVVGSLRVGETPAAARPVVGSLRVGRTPAAARSAADPLLGGEGPALERLAAGSGFGGGGPAAKPGETDCGSDRDRVGEAVRLWRGAPLPEFPGEPFRGIAARLVTLYRAALVRHAASLIAAGRPADAAAELHPAADTDPCWEDGAIILATALAAAGCPGDALEALRRHADAVVDQLGIDPSDEVRRTQLALLRGDRPPGPRTPPPPTVATSRTRPNHGGDGHQPHPEAAAGAGGDAAGGPGEWRISPERAERSGPGSRIAVDHGRDAPGVPLRFSSFLGREGEQRQLAGMLAEPGLVSVIGPGGVGKTRLVAETVRAAAGVAWVDAADVREEDFVEAVAVGVGARVAPHDDPFAMIGAAGRRHRVVVLDNCEHVLGSAARVAEALRGVRVVVTSQESLRVDGERVLRLGPLEAGAARRLFGERARVPVSALVGEIVERLDLLPLAIELAATQAAALGVDELHARLDDRLDLLNRGRRDHRHPTLRAVVEWSFGLLDEPSERLLRRLAVFAGAFSVAAAEAVAADDPAPRGEQAAGARERGIAAAAAAREGGIAAAGARGSGGLARVMVAPLLAGLVDRSLVARHGPGRFRLLETVRAYATEDPGAERAETEARHAAAMATAAEELNRRMRGPDQAAAVREIDALLPDLRLAFARGRPGDRVRLAAALYRYGYRCQQYEVLAWGRAALDGPGHPDAFAAAATHAWGRGDLDEARELAGRADPPGAAAHEVLGDVALVACDAATAAAHYRAMDGDALARVSGLTGEALVLAWSGRTGEAVALAGEAVALADATGNPGARAEARYGLGEALGDTDPERALALLDEAVALAVPVDDRLFQAAAGTAAVAVRSRHGDPVPALAEFRRVLRLWRRAGNHTLRAAALRNLIVLLVRVGADEAAVLLDGALPPAELYPAEAARLDRARAAAAERLGPGRVAALRQRGELLGPSQAAEEASRDIDAALEARRAG